MYVAASVEDMAAGSPISKGGAVVSRQSVTSFLLGALLPTALLFFLASDRVGERLSSISSLGLIITRPPLGNLSMAGNGGSAAPASQEEITMFPGLTELLPMVATDDRTVIITSVNEAWARRGSLLELFREGFKGGEGIAHLLNHTLVVAVDSGGFAECRAVHPYCYLLDAKSLNISSGGNYFMTKGYLELVWAKLSLQQRVLELGYNYLFTDTDIIWFRNPFRHISLYADMTLATDWFKGDPESPANLPNTGFYYVKSTNRTVEMVRRWRAARARFPTDHDQAAFNHIKGELAGGDLRIRFVFLDTALISGFCQMRDDIGRICAMHANCCVGLENKVHDLRNVVADWKNYTSLPAPEKKSVRFKWTVPALCRKSRH